MKAGRNLVQIYCVKSVRILREVHAPMEILLYKSLIYVENWSGTTYAYIKPIEAI